MRGLRWGLSPLARGNPISAAQKRERTGPIPARTGQPLVSWPCLWQSGAYPRSHGATKDENCPRYPRRGLSPLARGNQKLAILAQKLLRPIPARTGQPRWWVLRAARGGAYPRSHGATWICCYYLRRRYGLSPLARGNPLKSAIAKSNTGPIPARTGQPDERSAQTQSARAYPRSHGATQRRIAKPWLAAGLSPLARGNPFRAMDNLPEQGPIPARTGQPNLPLAL